MNRNKATAPKQMHAYRMMLALAATTVMILCTALLSVEQPANAGMDDVGPEAYGFSQKIVDPVRTNTSFGTALVMDGNTAAFRNTSGGTSAILFYTKTGGTWTFAQRLLPPDVGMPDSGFGDIMAIDGDTLVVNKPNFNASQGAAYVFVRTAGTWAFQQQITSADGVNPDQFGRTGIAVEGDTIVVGSHFSDIAAAGDNKGAAYVFTRTAGVWTQQQKLTAADGLFDDNFGFRVSLSGNTIAVGVPNADKLPDLNDLGAVYIFTRSAGIWSQQQKIDGPTEFGEFADSLVLDGDTFVAGDDGADATSGGLGTEGVAWAYTRTGSTWALQQRLFANDGYRFDRFAETLSLDGDRLAVGTARGNIGSSYDQGAVYILQRNGSVWSQQKVFAVDGTAGDQFGHGVAVSGSDVLVGVPLETGGGAAYYFADAFTTPPAFCQWTNEPYYPTANIHWHGVATVGNAIYSFGGFQDNTLLANAYKFDGIRWTPIAPLPVALRGPAVATDGTHIYIAGGVNSANATVNTLYRYDPVTDSYTTLATAPNSTWLSGAAIVGGKFYKIGGWTGQFPSSTTAVSVYDIATNTWSAAANYPISEGNLAAATDGSFIYTAGGQNTQELVTSKTYRYEPATNTWNDAAVADLPAGRNGPDAVFVNGRFTVSGGAIGGGTTTEVISLDPATNTWGTFILERPVLGGRTDAAVAVLNGEMHQVGGRLAANTRSRDHFRMACSAPAPSGCKTSVAYTGSAVSIPDNVPAGVSVPLTVSGVGSITDLDLRFDGQSGTSEPGIQHLNVGDLKITLTSPAGTTLTLVNRILGGNCRNVNISQMTLDDDALPPVQLNCAEDVGDRYPSLSFSPDGNDLAAFNGENANGTWTLNVADMQASNPQGNNSIRHFSLLFGAACGTPTPTPTPAVSPTPTPTPTVTPTVTPTPGETEFDFDGDGRADLAVFRPMPDPAANYWYIRKSSDGSSSATEWGIETDSIAPADYDGDGKADIAVWRDEASDPDRANFYILLSSTSAVRIAQFGRTGDSPILVGDWDGDGTDDPAVYRDGGGGQSFIFYRPSSQPAADFSTIHWGLGGDTPMRGDFDGDGTFDAAVFRPSDSTVYIRQSSNGQIRYEKWGSAGDTFVPADYDGDGRTDLAVFRGGVWYILQSSNGQPRYDRFGLATDLPVPADYDGDGRADIGVFRDGIWYLNQSTGGFTAVRYGLTGDQPVSAFAF